MDDARIHAILSGAAKGPWPALLRTLTAAAEPAYAAAVRRRNAAFDRQGGRRLPRPVVSVGNLTTGGTGKTPMVVWVARRLMAAGHQPCVLMRGYRSRDGRSDEAEELRAAGIPQVRPHPERGAEADRALAEDPAISCFILDDGFQHRQLARDLDIVLVDASCPFGHGRLLPRGLLREPRENLRRAGAVVVTRADQGGDLAGLTATLTRLWGRPPTALCRHAWDGFAEGPPGRERTHPAGALAGRRVAAACGIGNPGAFLRQAEAAAGTLVLAEPKADHHPWSAAECRDLLARAGGAGAETLLLPEKDFVKWLPHLAALPPAPALWRPRLDLQFLSGADELAKLLPLRTPTP